MALGDSWIAPLDYVRAWGPLLEAWSLLDERQLARLGGLVAATEVCICLFSRENIWSYYREIILTIVFNPLNMVRLQLILLKA